MTVPKHFKIVFRGVFLLTEETWSFSTHWSRGSNLAIDATLDDIDETGVDNAFMDLMGGDAGAAFGTHVQATEWRAYQMDTTNEMEGNPLIRILDTPTAGNGSRQLPPQCALVVTKVAANRGPGRLGRFFLPCPSVDLVGSQITEAATADWLAVATTFVKAVSDQINNPVPLESTVMLNISERPAGSGTKQEVDHLEVGRVVDTMRSRRRSLEEDRVVGGHIDW